MRGVPELSTLYNLLQFPTLADVFSLYEKIGDPNG